MMQSRAGIVETRELLPRHRDLFRRRIEVTTRFPDVLEKLSKQMDSITMPLLSDAASNRVPVCIKDYATGANVVRKIDPSQVDPKFTTVPVRIIINKEGKVEHIHVINALPEQARSVQDALVQWTFKPYMQKGRAVDVETGILFEFPPGGRKSRTVKAEVRSP